MIILFGATGDLAKKKLLPALFSLYKKRKLENVPVVCVGRRALSIEEYRSLMGLEMYAQDPSYLGFTKQLFYRAVSLDADGTQFSKEISDIGNRFKTRKKLVYLSISQDLFDPTIKLLQRSKLLGSSTSVAFEKPFGQDLASSEKLHNSLKKVFKEHQIYRVDHYLGKDLVDNLMTMRFSNALFEQLWNRSVVDNVQIVLSEDLGIEGRGEYYDSAGAIRDMVQNHIMQVLSLTAMDLPLKSGAESIRDAKVSVIKKLAKVKPSDVVVGQYLSGNVAGAPVPGYLEESEVRKGSKTETFVAFKTFISSTRWKGVPFYIKTGKRLDSKYAEVNLVLKKPVNYGSVAANIISVRLGPKQEGIALQCNSQIPGTREIKPITLEFCHKCEFGPNSAESYERLFGEMLSGNQALFARWDEVKESWKFTDALLKTARSSVLHSYAAGTSGPGASDLLLKKDNRFWVRVDRKLTI